MLLFLRRHGHKNTVLSVKWNSNGNWVLTASRDQTIKVLFFSFGVGKLVLVAEILDFKHSAIF